MPHTLGLRAVPVCPVPHKASRRPNRALLAGLPRRLGAAALVVVATFVGPGVAGAAAPGGTAAKAHAAKGAATARPGAGVRFVAGSLDHALAQAKAQGKRVFVDFDASWCPSCRQLEREVLATAEGAALFKDLIAVHVDFDDEANRPYIERYVILGLPTAAVLDADGNQLVRVTGYESKASWTTPMRAALTASDPIPALRKAFAAKPGDADARLALGKALLERNVVPEAFAVLEPLLWATVGVAKAEGAAGEARDAARERAAEVLWTLGRYHHRVRRDPGTAQHLWRELATRFGATSWAGGAWSWFAKSQAELGRAPIGAVALAAAARREPSVDTIGAWLRFARTYGLVGEHAAIDEASLKLGTGEEAAKIRGELEAWK